MPKALIITAALAAAALLLGLLVFRRGTKHDAAMRRRLFEDYDRRRRRRNGDGPGSRADLRGERNGGMSLFRWLAIAFALGFLCGTIAGRPE